MKNKKLSLLASHLIAVAAAAALSVLATQGALAQKKYDTGASKWNDPKEYPWTMGFQPSYRVEARIFAKYILKTKPDAKVAVFYANDDFGKDYVAGLKEVFGDKSSSIIVAEESYETTEHSIDSHIVKLKGTGADVFVNISTPKLAAQAIKEMAELEWKPM